MEGGVYGGHDWRRQSIGLDYRGDYRRQQAFQGLNGSNHVLSFDYMVRPKRRLQLVLRQAGGTTNRAFGSFAAPAFGDTSRLGIPLSELFDVRTYFAQSGATVLWTKSPRLQFSFGGDAFFVKRQALSLINSQGYDGRALMLYRLTRNTSAGLEYQYFKFDFPRVYSGTEAHGPGIRIRRTFFRKVSAEALVGALIFNSFGTEQVRLSPAVAEILGRTTTLASFVRNNVNPNLELSATLQQERGSFRAQFSSGVGAGNGVYLATQRTTVNAGYSYTGIRRASFGVSGGWTRNSSVTLNLNSFETWQLGTGASYRVAEGLNFTSQFDYRSMPNLGLTRARSGTSFSFGINYSTSRMPLSVW